MTAAAARGAILTLVFIASPAFSLMASRAFYRHTLTTAFTPAARELIAALRERTNASGRLMIEDGPAWAYGNTFLPALLPLYTGVEQIGGPYPFTFIKHHFAAFRTCQAFGSELRGVDPRRLRQHLELYNVRWILTATPECAAAFEDFSYLTTVWSSGAFTLREVELPAAFASDPEETEVPIGAERAGAPRIAGIAVRASYGLIHVTIAPEQSPPERILLKYHWDKGLHVASPARISPAARLDDPVPFIVLEPNGEFDIRILFGPAH
jgi:hypothetical protein